MPKCTEKKRSLQACITKPVYIIPKHSPPHHTTLPPSSHKKVNQNSWADDGKTVGNADIHNHRRIFVCSYMAALDDKGNRKCWRSFEGKGYTNHILKISTEKGLGEGGREREKKSFVALVEIALKAWRPNMYRLIRKEHDLTGSVYLLCLISKLIFLPCSCFNHLNVSTFSFSCVISRNQWMCTKCRGPLF